MMMMMMMMITIMMMMIMMMMVVVMMMMLMMMMDFIIKGHRRVVIGKSLLGRVNKFEVTGIDCKASAQGIGR